MTVEFLSPKPFGIEPVGPLHGSKKFRFSPCVATAFRHRALFDLGIPETDAKLHVIMSPKPFGFEPFSDKEEPALGLRWEFQSPEPFGFEPFSDRISA